MTTSRRTPSSLRLTWLLLVTLALLNAASFWGILAARRGARSAAEHDLELRTTVLARSVEAELASLRADFLFLAQSPPVTSLVDSLGSSDTSLDGRSRRDAEGTLLLFLEAHPEVRRLEIEDAGGRALVVVGWQQESARVFAPTSAPGTSTSWFQGRWPTDPSNTAGAGLHAWIDQERLFAGVVPAAQDSLTLQIAAATPPGAAETNDGLLASVPVVDGSWEPPVTWVMTAREEEGQLLRSVQALTGLYGTTVGLNVAVMTLSLILGYVAFRNLRHAVRLEAEREQQEKVVELERQLLHSERLASLGRLAAGLAHEINNPLEGVSNYLGLLDEDLEKSGLDDSQQLLRQAREGVSRAADVIRQVLTYSDPARGATTLLDLRSVLERSVEFVRQGSEHRNVEIRLSLPSEPLWVEGNPVTLGQVLLNLLLNACEARPGEGVVDVSADVEGECSVVRVCDRGPGIDAESLSHIFEPFFTTKGSTGLGLAVSRGIVKSHGGTLEAANRPDGGAQLTLRLPLERQEELIS